MEPPGPSKLCGADGSIVCVTSKPGVKWCRHWLTHGRRIRENRRQTRFLLLQPGKTAGPSDEDIVLPANSRHRGRAPTLWERLLDATVWLEVTYVYASWEALLKKSVSLNDCDAVRSTRSTSTMADAKTPRINEDAK